MDDYTRIARVIEYIEEHREEQPSLGELAGVVGLSESYFHRLFRRWAGVTPKDFLQCLTVEDARKRLHESATVLDAAVDSGMSGPGRLHDLFVTIEAATPGEIRSGGEGVEIRWGDAETPFGWASIGVSPRGICHLAFEAEKPSRDVPAALLNRWPKSTLERDPAVARKWGDLIFSPTPRDTGLSAWVAGTDFQLQVWRALLRIPEGNVATYRQVAEAIGRRGAARTVGTACGSNPIAYLIPCHRVIRETGIVTGYRWGSERKKAILAREWSSTRSEPR